MKIPFELVGGIIMLDVCANGKEGKMAFDTGAMQTCLNKNYFEDFEGEEKEVSKFDGAVKTETTVKGKCDIKCHDWELTETSVMLLDMNYVEKPLKGAKPDLVFLGTMGIDIIRDHKVLLDYATSQLIFDEEILESAETYDMNAEVLPVIDVCIGEESYKFVLDTGANTCMLDDSFKQKGFKVLNETAGVVQIPTVSALGGEYRDTMAVITNMAAIKAKVDVSGVIGYQILKDCISYFDFVAGKISIQRTIN
jgi:hypothetical protein